MKSLTILLLFISTLSFSQIDEEIKYLQTHNPKWFSNTAGQELRKSNNHFYSGFVISVAGSFIVSNNLGPDANPVFSKIGWGTLLVGSFLMLESHRHIYRAGLILDSRGVGITIPLNKK
jgi:hypothetical protein